MKIRPLGDRLVLEKIIEEEKTLSGIILPKNIEGHPETAKVIEVSDKVKEKAEIKVGDEVLYDQYLGKSIKDGDKEYILIKQADILAIIE